jgi:hypothetical protein
MKLEGYGQVRTQNAIVERGGLLILLGHHQLSQWSKPRGGAPLDLVPIKVGPP